MVKEKDFVEFEKWKWLSGIWKMKMIKDWFIDTVFK